MRQTMSRTFQAKIEIFVYVDVPDNMPELNVESWVNYEAKLLANKILWEEKTKFEITPLE
jgi:hypothetical protein